MGAALFIGPPEVLLQLAKPARVVVDVALNRILAFDEADIAALRRADRLADPGISPQIRKGRKDIQRAVHDQPPKPD